MPHRVDVTRQDVAEYYVAGARVAVHFSTRMATDADWMQRRRPSSHGCIAVSWRLMTGSPGSMGLDRGLHAGGLVLRSSTLCAKSSGQFTIPDFLADARQRASLRSWGSFCAIHLFFVYVVARSTGDRPDREPDDRPRVGVGVFVGLAGLWSARCWRMRR